MHQLVPKGDKSECWRDRRLHMKQPTHFRSFVVVLTTLLMGCHIESIHPLSDPADTTHDERLSGTWSAKGKNRGDTIYLHLGKAENGSTSAVWIAHDHTGQIRLGVFKIVPTRLDEETYASVQMVESESLRKKEPSYFFVKYSIDSAQKLTLWDLDLRAAISNERLKATAGRITDSTAALRHWVALARLDERFLTESHITFEKLATK